MEHHKKVDFVSDSHLALTSLHECDQTCGSSLMEDNDDPEQENEHSHQIYLNIVALGRCFN